MTICIISTTISKEAIFGIVLTTIIWLYSLSQTTLAALLANINMAFYYYFCVLYFIFFNNHSEQFWKILVSNQFYIKAIVLIYNTILIISIFRKESYVSMSGGWGNGKYFVSISDSPNRVGPASLYIMVLIIFLVIQGNKLISCLALPQVYVFLMGGSRTYFVIGLCTVLILLYILIDNKLLFSMSLIPIAGIMIFLTLKSSMIEKFSATFIRGSSLDEFLLNITNRRSSFWMGQMALFKESPTINKLLGNGINFTTYYYGFWAHNDFIEILCSYGYIGVINYIVIILMTIKHFLYNSKNNCLLIIVVTIIIWLFNASINFFFCYFCAMLCYPILLLCIDKYGCNGITKRI